MPLWAKRCLQGLLNLVFVCLICCFEHSARVLLVKQNGLQSCSNAVNVMHAISFCYTSPLLHIWSQDHTMLATDMAKAYHVINCIPETTLESEIAAAFVTSKDNAGAACNRLAERYAPAHLLKAAWSKCHLHSLAPQPHVAPLLSLQQDLLEPFEARCARCWRHCQLVPLHFGQKDGQRHPPSPVPVQYHLNMHRTLSPPSPVQVQYHLNMHRTLSKALSRCTTQAPPDQYIPCRPGTNTMHAWSQHTPGIHDDNEV